MSPLTQLSKGQDGKLEITQLQTTESVQVCVEFNRRSLTNTYFEDGKTQQRFYVLNLGDAVSVNINLYNGAAWLTWVWIWEDQVEAEEAWSKVPAGLTETIEQLTQRINDFIRDARRTGKSGKSKVVHDITPELKSIGWEMTLLDYTIDEVARSYQAYCLNRKARKQENIGQQEKLWWEFWRK
jgi:hypothetical protein